MSSPERAEVIVSLGGDGFMLETLHRFLSRGVPIYGMHRGSVGFLMNAYRPAGLRHSTRLEVQFYSLVRRPTDAVRTSSH